MFIGSVTDPDKYEDNKHGPWVTIPEWTVLCHLSNGGGVPGGEVPNIWVHWLFCNLNCLKESVPCFADDNQGSAHLGEMYVICSL